MVESAEAAATKDKMMWSVTRAEPTNSQQQKIETYLALNLYHKLLFLS